MHLGPGQVIVPNLDNKTLKPGITTTRAAVTVRVPAEEAPVSYIEMVVADLGVVVGGDLASLDGLVVEVTNLTGIVLHTSIVVVFSAAWEAVFIRARIGIKP